MPSARTARDNARINVSDAERIASAVGGVALTVRAWERPTLGRFLLAIGGLALLQRAFTGHCMLYERLGIGSASSVGDVQVPHDNDPVTCASEDSFPASDPPSWTPVSGPGTRH